jgi:uncharacterized protein (TIGR02246 family)
MRQRSRLIVASLVGTLACTPAGSANKADTSVPTAATTASASDLAAVKQSIDSNLARFTAAFVKADTTAALAEYANDAILMLPNQKALHGHNEIAQSMVGFFASGKISSFTSRSEGVILSGDYAIENGVYDMTFQPKGAAKPIHDVGKYLTVWKRQTDGTWKMIRDINNTDLPLK